MQGDVSLQVSEKRFQSIGRFGNAGVIYENEHIRQSSAEMGICLTNHFVCEPFSVGQFLYRSSIDVTHMLIVPICQKLFPIQHVVVCLYLADQTDYSPK